MHPCCHANIMCTVKYLHPAHTEILSTHIAFIVVIAVRFAEAMDQATNTPVARHPNEMDKSSYIRREPGASQMDTTMRTRKKALKTGSSAAARAEMMRCKDLPRAALTHASFGI